MINFWVLYMLVYAVFLDVWTCKNWKYIFLRYGGYKCTNIFSIIEICLWVTQCQVCIYWKRKYFSSCVSSTYFCVRFVSFSFSPPPKFSPNFFSQNVFCFSYFYRGRKLFLKPMLFLGGIVALNGGSCLYCL